MNKIIFLLLLCIIVATGIAGVNWYRSGSQEVPLRYATAQADIGDVSEVVYATGTINPVKTVQVGSQVSGTVSALYADFNTRVVKGQRIAQIDPALFQAAVDQARADLLNAKASVASAAATVEKAKATAEQARLDFHRAEQLAKQGVYSQQQFDDAKGVYDADVAQVEASAAQVQMSRAMVVQKQAAVENAEINLRYTHIYAPVDGTVTARTVDVGQTVAASFQTPNLFSIAQDLKKMQVYASIDEGDIGNVHPGQKVSFRVDAFPGESFGGVVEQTRLNPTVVQNVVTYSTIVNFDNSDLRLLPGMTAYLTLPVAGAKSTLRVPDAALRFEPRVSPEVRKTLLEGAGIQSADAAAPGTGLVWEQVAGSGTTIRPVLVLTGVSDHSHTEIKRVLKGELKAGDACVTAALGGPRKPAGD